MKTLLFIIMSITLVLPVGAFAEMTENELWETNLYLYRFTVARQGSEIVVGYELTTGDAPDGSGSWQLVILGPHSQPIAWQSFDLTGDSVRVLIRYQPNGTSAQVLDSQGSVVTTINLAGSRVCDEDGVCESQYGEVSNNCPADCGSAYAAGTAVAASQSGIGRRVGAILMGLALAATGLLLMRGIGGLLDRRYHS